MTCQMNGMTSPEKPQRHWLRTLILGFVSLFVLAAIGLFAFEVVSSQRGMWQEQSQIDTSSGQIRFVKTRANVEEAGEPKDTFISLQLKGRTIAPKPDWRPMTTHWGGGFSGSHGHSGVDRVWNRYSEVESLWDKGGFTEQAKTACATRMLELISSNDLSACYDFVDALEKHVDALDAVPEAQRRTTVEDVEALDE